MSLAGEAVPQTLRTKRPLSRSDFMRVALVFLAVFASFTSIGIVLPVLPLYLRRVMHATPDALGFVVG